MPDDTHRGEPTDPTPDALRRLEERLDRASRAAERLIAEARGAAPADAERRPPSAEWQAPRSEAGDDGRARAARAADPVGARTGSRRSPAALSEALRELLLVLRALIDFYLERLERGDAGLAEMKDIPIS